MKFLLLMQVAPLRRSSLLLISLPITATVSTPIISWNTPKKERTLQYTCTQLEACRHTPVLAEDQIDA